jgi:glycosyltransferase involved in cell wall biosynthesis
MKIAHIFYSLSYGGIETLMVNIANWQVKNGHSVSIILMNDIYEQGLIDLIDDQVDIVQLKRKPKTSAVMSVAKLNLCLLLKQFDILHIHAAEIGNIIQHFLKGQKILHVHSTTDITNTVIPKYKKCIAISNAVSEILISQYNRKSQVIYNGVDFSKFEKRKHYSVAQKIIAVGSLNTRVKNQDWVISEFSSIRDRVDANLYIVGHGPDYQFLHDLIERLNLSDRVFLLGNKSQDWIQHNLCNYDLFVQASLTEGLGISAIEAAASCVPLLLSNIDGHIEIAVNGELCVLFDPKVEGELASAIVAFYNNTYQYFDAATRNYDIYELKFSFDLFNKKIIDLYNAL